MRHIREYGRAHIQLAEVGGEHAGQKRPAEMLAVIAPIMGISIIIVTWRALRHLSGVACDYRMGDHVKRLKHLGLKGG